MDVDQIGDTIVLAHKMYRRIPPVEKYWSAYRGAAVWVDGPSDDD